MGNMKSAAKITGRTKGNYGSTKKAMGTKILDGPLTSRPSKSR